MSAFVVSENHINTIVTAYSLSGSRLRIAGRVFESRCKPDLTEIGRILFAANIESVLTRYPQDTPDMYPDPAAYEFRTVRPANAVQIIKACKCLAYQSCETDDWEDSPARKILDAIISEQVYDLPGYEAASWEIA